MELIGKQYRIYAGVATAFTFAFGYLILAGVSYWLKDWKYTQIAISIPSFLFLSYYW